MPDPRTAGDYLRTVYLGAAPLARSVLYTADTNVRCLVRHLGVANTTGAVRTVSVWIGGVLLVPSRSVDPTDTLAFDVSMYHLAPGQSLEAQADAAGVNLAVFGVEEVTQ